MQVSGAGNPAASRLVFPAGAPRVYVVLSRLVVFASLELWRKVLLFSIVAGIIVGIKVAVTMAKLPGSPVTRPPQVQRHRVSRFFLNIFQRLVYGKIC